ncbi:lipopolysaccharide biosynthesis protein [Modestobacter sp. SSW1-42]|uniref:lipopolysaccharide biosynthesis protein n=1 Tax=Modestobacter sp. SSW1-42 TaxID=596372 RepID=UPI00398880F6
MPGKPDDGVLTRPWAGVLRGGGARLLVLPVSAVLGIVVTRLLIDDYGPAAYAQYGLLVGLGALLPFADLGMAAAVMNAVSSSAHPASDDAVRRTLVTALRVLVASALVLALLTVAVSVLGLWPALLGDGLLPGPGPAVVAGCLLLIALGIPVGIGQRVLVGLGRNHVAIAVQGLLTPVVLLVLLALVWTGLPAGGVFPVVPYAVTLVLALICTWLAARSTAPVFGQALRAAPRLRTERGGPVLGVAWPMLVVMVAVPLAMQSDRLLLSHLRGDADLAQYNLAAQMFVPVWSVVNAAGLALWPVFARARADRSSASPFPMAAAFAGAGVVLAGGVALLSPWLAEVASGGRISLDAPLVVAFAALMVVQAAKYPLGMYLTDAAGLRFQAGMVVLMAAANLGLSWVLTERWGAPGPVVGSLLSVVVFELTANAWYVRRRLRDAGPAVTATPELAVSGAGR